MQRSGLLLLLLWLFVSFLQESEAVPSDFYVSHYTSENGLPQNSIKFVVKDKNGFLWLRTESGLVRFDGQRFRLYDRAHFPILKSNRIFHLHLTKDGLVWFADEYDQYYTFDQEHQIVQLTDKESRNLKKPLYDEFFKLKGEKMLTRATEKGVLWTLPIPDFSSTGYAQETRTRDRFYFFTESGELCIVDKQKRRIRMKVTGILPGHNTRNNNALGLFNQDEQLYLHQGKGIYALEEKGADELKATLLLETDEPDIIIYRNYPSINLQIVGSPTHGLYLYRKKQFRVHKYANGNGNYYAQQPYGDSGVLTNGGLVFPSFSKLSHPSELRGVFKAIYRDRNGHYWVNKANDKHYIAELDEQLQPVRLVATDGQAISCFGETPDGRMWLSSYNGDRLGYLEQDMIYWLPLRFPYNSIITFLPLSNEELLLAGNKLLCRLDTRTGRQTHYEALERFTIETLHQDQNKVLWIGTSGNGLFALKQNRVYKLPLDSKGSLSNVHTFMEDKSGFIWMSTNNGLFRAKKAALDGYIAGKADSVYYQYFSKADGFNTNEFNGSCNPSGIVLGNGKFSLPSLDGLVQFYADSIRSVESGRALIIDRLSVDGKEIASSASLTLAPSFTHLEIEIAAPYFGDPANQLIEYNVQGLDHQWYPVRADNKVTLNRLPYGRYGLRFRAQSGFDNDDRISMVLPFTVTPFFYQTWYFRLGVIMIILLCLFLAIRFRYVYLVKRNRKLEEEVGQRTRKLQQANKLKEKMLMMVGHDLQSPLHFMSLLSRHVQTALDQQQIDKVRSGNEEIRTTATKIHAFVEEFSLWSRLQDENFNLTKRKFLLSGVIEDLFRFYSEMLQQNDNRMEWEVNEAYELETNRELLKAMLRNLLDNANKHTRQGIIRIQCYSDADHRLTIEVSDTGKGMSEIELNNIRRRIDDRTEAFVKSHTSKLGYQLIIDFAASLDIQLSIDSKKEVGTVVSLSGLPFRMADPDNSGSLPRETISRSELY